MLSKIETARLNRQLKELGDKYRNAYDSLRQTSENRYKASLQPGQTFHTRQGFYYNEERQAFREACEDLKQEAHRLVDKLALDLMAENTKAPTAEAVNVVALLNTRSEVSADEIDELMTVYGRDCPLIYKSLKEKAESLGYRDFLEHPVTRQAENMKALTDVIDRTFDPIRAENHNMAVTVAGLTSTVDMALPAGEGE